MAIAFDKIVFLLFFITMQWTNDRFNDNKRYQIECWISFWLWNIYMTLIMLPRRIKHNIIHITIGFMRFKINATIIRQNVLLKKKKKDKTLLKIFKSIENNYDKTRIEEGNCSSCSIWTKCLDLLHKLLNW